MSRAWARPETSLKLNRIPIKFSTSHHIPRLARISIDEISYCQLEMGPWTLNRSQQTSTSSPAKTAWILNSKWCGNSSKHKGVSWPWWEVLTNRIHKKATTWGQQPWCQVPAEPIRCRCRTSKSLFKRTRSSIRETNQNLNLEQQVTLAWTQVQQEARSKLWYSKTEVTSVTTKRIWPWAITPSSRAATTPWWALARH